LSQLARVRARACRSRIKKNLLSSKILESPILMSVRKTNSYKLIRENMTLWVLRRVAMLELEENGC